MDNTDLTSDPTETSSSPVAPPPFSGEPGETGPMTETQPESVGGAVSDSGVDQSAAPTPAELDAQIADKKAELAYLDEQIAQATKQLDALHAEAEAQASGDAPTPGVPTDPGAGSTTPLPPADVPPVPVPGGGTGLGQDRAAVEAPKTYTLGPDDTLDSVADDLGINRDKLFELNRVTLDTRAQAQGFTGSEGGQLLFTDTVLVLP